IRNWRPPQDIANQLRWWLDHKSRLRYLGTMRAGPIDVSVYLSRYTLTMRGPVGDIAYSLELVEWRTLKLWVDHGEETPGGGDAQAAVAAPATTDPQADEIEEPTPSEYTVVPGDNLSYIAKALLGDAGRWPEIYESNRETIGDNPNLIYPGQVLSIPGG